jgi:magnesium transporter
MITQVASYTLYLSELTGKLVTDTDGENIGILVDLVASLQPNISRPVIAAIVVKRKGKELIIPSSDVMVLSAPVIPIKERIQDIKPYQPAEDDLFLVQDVLDKQIIDINGVRVVRVNDLELARIPDPVNVNGKHVDYVVSNVDISSVGILRRIGLTKVAKRFTSQFRDNPSRNVISWNEIELLHHGQFVRLKVPGEKIAELHPADLAEIISEMNRLQSDKFLESFDVKKLADTLEEVEPDFQASLVESMSDEKVADVLEEMSPDEAADLLAELPKERSEDLLELMEDEKAEDVSKLLTYPEDSAGGIMTTEFVVIQPDLTAEHAISILRVIARDVETILYVYVVDIDDHLIGVFSLQDLLLAKSETQVKDFMDERVISVELLDERDHVAQIISKYNLLTVPVVDDQQHLLGIVTWDDALDEYIPPALKKRLPHFYH